MATSVNQPIGRNEIHEAVLDAAERLFAERGASQVSLRSIAEAANVTYSLVNRHFGTKEALVEQVLERFERRWLGRLADGATYGEALDILFGTSADSGSAIRLMAWTLLSGEESDAADAQRRHLALDRIAALRDPTSPVDVRLDVAAAISLSFGWRFFGSLVRDAVHLGEVDDDRLHDALRARMHRVAGVDPADRA